MLTYHIDINWPSHVAKNLPFGVRQLRYTKHALEQARRRGVPIPKAVDMSKTTVFEADCPQKGVVSKIVFRFPLDMERDMVIAAIPQRGGLVVKTCWTNSREDCHKTLDKSRYVR